MGLGNRPMCWWKAIIDTAHGNAALESFGGRICDCSTYSEDLLIDLCGISAIQWRGQFYHTHVLSEMDTILGAKGDVGKEEFKADGEPRPDIPDTLCLLFKEAGPAGRAWGNWAMDPKIWRLEVELDVSKTGGVVEP